MELIKTKARVFALMVTVLAAVLGAGLAGSAGITGPPPVSAEEMERIASTFYLECPTQEVDEGDSFEIYLVREPVEGRENINFSAWWHTDPGSADENDYLPLPGENEDRRWSNDAERAANRQARTVFTIDDDEPEGNEDFWVRFSPAEYVSNPDHPGRDEKCRITIIDDDPHVTGIEIISSPARIDTYGLGETIEIAVTFNHPVEVDGKPLMGFWMGGQWKGAQYQRGSGTDTLVFSYTVQPDDIDTNGISVHDGYRDSSGRLHGFGGGGDIFALGTAETPDTERISVNKIYQGIPDQPGHKVAGGMAPRILEISLVQRPADWETYRAGEKIVIDVIFSAPVRALNTPQVNLWFDGAGGAVWRGARYESGSGTNTLRFAYEVQPGDRDTDGLLVGYQDRQGLGEGKIKALDHDVDADHSYREFQTGYKVYG